MRNTVFALLLMCGVALLFAPPFRGATPPLEHGASSPEVLAAAVLDAFARRDTDALSRLALSQSEFVAHVWPSLPASRPERNLSSDYVWDDLHGKSRAYLRSNLARPLPRHARLLRLEFTGGTSEYRGYRVHRDSRLVLVDPAGAAHSIRLFGAMLEKDGVYKVFSYVTD